MQHAKNGGIVICIRCSIDTPFVAVNLLSTDEDGVATNKSFPVNSYVGCAIPSQQNASKIVVALQNGLSELCVETGSVTPLEGVPSVLHDDLKSGDIRFNDGKADPAGRYARWRRQLNQIALTPDYLFYADLLLEPCP
jgi:hypothetical protein